MAARSATSLVITALACNVAITLAMFTAAAWAGSSAMLATAIQTLIGVSSQGLMLYGLTRPDRADSQGGSTYEIYFWSFGVAVLLFSLGAGIAIYDGTAKLADPLPNKYNAISYSVLAVSLIVLAVVVRLALKQLAPASTDQRAPTSARASQEPAASTVAIEGLAGLLGIIVAASGIAISDLLAAPSADGYAAITVGLLLGIVAAFMSLEIRSLLIGRAGDGKRIVPQRPAPASARPPFFIEDDPTVDPPRANVGSAASAPSRAIGKHAAPVSAATTSDALRPLSRKERKRQKHKR